jgi:hypothetical protein
VDLQDHFYEHLSTCIKDELVYTASDVPAQLGLKATALAWPDMAWLLNLLGRAKAIDDDICKHDLCEKVSAASLSFISLFGFYVVIILFPK